VEALLRWQHPELGPVDPGRFIPVAEETGLIEAIGEWVLQQACIQMRAWCDAGIAPAAMAVNLSAKQLAHSGICSVVARALAAVRLEPRYLELELTESASMHDPEANMVLTREIKALGVGLAIDDFGTGYSNMNYLRRFPVDLLKLDGSFIRDMQSDAGCLTIVDAMISMSHRLGLLVVAERVENTEQVRLLRDRDCDIVQGRMRGSSPSRMLRPPGTGRGIDFLEPPAVFAPKLGAARSGTRFAARAAVKYSPSLPHRAFSGRHHCGRFRCGVRPPGPPAVLLQRKRNVRFLGESPSSSFMRTTGFSAPVPYRELPVGVGSTSSTH